MNNRERFLRTMRFEPVDRVPNFEFNLWEQTLDRWLDEGLPPGAIPTRSIMWGCEYLGIDRRAPVVVKLSMIPPFDEEIIEETERHRIYRHPEGRLRKALRVGESRSYRLSMDQYLSFPVKDREVEIDCFSFAEDFAYKAGPLISPEIFRKFFLPRYRQLTDFLKAQGVPSIWLDTDGNFEVLIPLLLEAGITCVWPLEVASGMDPVALRKKYGQDLVLSGGIDKRALAKSRQEIEQELTSKLPYLLEQGGYIPTLDHSVPPDVPLDNYRYYLGLKSKLLEGRFGV